MEINAYLVYRVTLTTLDTNMHSIRIVTYSEKGGEECERGEKRLAMKSRECFPPRPLSPLAVK